MLKQVMLVVRPLKVGARKLIIPGNGMTIYIYDTYTYFEPVRIRYLQWRAWF
jgi:hypothetical protein